MAIGLAASSMHSAIEPARRCRTSGESARRNRRRERSRLPSSHCSPLDRLSTPSTPQTSGVDSSSVATVGSRTSVARSSLLVGIWRHRYHADPAGKRHGSQSDRRRCCRHRTCSPSEGREIGAVGRRSRVQPDSRISAAVGIDVRGCRHRTSRAHLGIRDMPLPQHLASVAVSASSHPSAPTYCCRRRRPRPSSEDPVAADGRSSPIGQVADGACCCQAAVVALLARSIARMPSPSRLASRCRSA